MRDRDEHLAWCKKQALEYLDRHDLANAYTSMCSDLSKHPELEAVGRKMAVVGLLYLTQHDHHAMRRWIEGFR